MTENTYLVFVHDDESWYLPYTVNQAVRSLPGATVCLIGSASARRSLNHYPALSRQVWFIPAESVASSQQREFTAHYRHLSTSSERFELFCWTRWFRVRRWMEENRIGQAAYVDSDVIVYAGAAARLFRSPATSVGVRQTDCALLIPAQEHGTFKWAVMGHTSRWSLDALDTFCEFAIDSYRNDARFGQYLEKHRWHERTGAAGGICDMTGLYLFCRGRGGRIENLALPTNGSVFDVCIAAADNYDAYEYMMSGGVKWTERTSAGRRAIRAAFPNDPVELLSVHCQGASKRLIPDYCSFELPRPSLRHLALSQARRTVGPLKRQLFG